ncbi:MAG: Rod shape-determining protein MreB [Candidatus Woesebacteria bacterium GW2011_GWA1_39_21]|uniref:Cell shape-determining protein MreB n=1 Tax=Candidatus Woesebacteria bacterium GW2011_GWA1_39_21 TaxID=1618550 RepID=A0A0G0N2U9_9BACT|nr:MAG: Rod shape-determining protein MreB [Candidatus Woesebacteria bacterium GW2011_GWA1_39_21]
MDIKLKRYNFFVPEIFKQLDKLWSLVSYDIGIDLGTSNTMVWVSGKGIVVREPSVVARHKKTKEIIAIGADARKMLGRTPANYEVIRPLRDGVIADFDAAEAMLSHYIKKVHSASSGSAPKIPKPRVAIGIPSGVTEVERRAVSDAVLGSGAREVNLIEEPMAAAIGAGLEVENATGHFIVDIGGGTSEMAVISLGGIVVGRSIRTAGDEMNEAISNFVKLKYSLLMGEVTAEDVKISLGNFSQMKEKFHIVRGRDLETGLPKSIKISTSEVREALVPVAQQIIGNITATLEETPPELVSDIMEKGIIMAGGGSMLSGIDKLVSEKTKMPVYISNDPLTCVVRGCAYLLEHPTLMSKLKVTKGL